jgi:CRP-like cAMP-binding protein/rhodanese-related sulfurtransferase
MTDYDEKVRRLSNTDVFGSISEAQLIEIARVVRDEVVPAKTVIFRKGDPGDSFYIVHSGEIRVFLTGDDGMETDLNRLGPGDSFGEIALLTEEPRSTDIETSEETHLFVLTKEEFDRVLKEHPDVFKNFIKHVSGMLRRDDRRLQQDTEREYRTTRLSFFDFLFIGFVILLFATIYNLSNPKKINVIPEFFDPEEVPKVELIEAKKEYDKGETIFIDARPSNFFNQKHIKGAINLPLRLFELIYMMDLSEEDKEKDIIIYGRSISALYDEEVARKLILRKHKNVKILKPTLPYMPLFWSGFSQWEKQGYPVEGVE